MGFSAIQRPIIRSKLHRLRISSQTVLRTRLLEQLADASGLVLVIAPAGYGKSTLLSSWRTLPFVLVAAIFLLLVLLPTARRMGAARGRFEPPAQPTAAASWRRGLRSSTSRRSRTSCQIGRVDIS